MQLLSYKNVSEFQDDLGFVELPRIDLLDVTNLGKKSK